MPFAAALSTGPDTLQALAAVCAQARSAFTDAPDLALLFYSPHHLRHAVELAETAQQTLQPRCLLGVPGETIIAGDQEIEHGPALALWLGRWPQPVELAPFHLYMEQTSEGMSLLGWPDALTGEANKQGVVLLLADPYTFPIDVFLQQMNDEQPGLRVVGGMASGTRGPGQCRMLLGGQQIDQGAVGVFLEGDTVHSVVSQGCRPVGKPMVITRAQDNHILELGGKSPLQQLQELWPTLPPRDQELLRQGLHLGRVCSEYQATFERGDFLVRNVMGLDRATGALAVTDRVRVGQTVQFHVRDWHSADEDLHTLLKIQRETHPTQPQGALLFSCNGRGTRLFEAPHHDARAIQRSFGALPLAGFFAQGELGPVGGQNFIHGFTASVVLFEG